MRKRLIAFVFSFILVLLFTSCKGNNTTQIPIPGAPAAPTGVAAAPGAQNITLEWSDVDKAQSFNLYYSTLSNTTKTTGTKIPNVTSPYAHSHLSAGSYYYVVTAVNMFGESSESAEVTANVNLVAFVTSTSGNGNLGSWADAGGHSGVAAADAICRGRASAAALTGNFKAWISDTSDDAYCRIHNLAGKKSDNCGQPSLPATAGPWVRTDGFPFADKIDKMLNQGQIYAPPRYDEYGTQIAGAYYFTNTFINGVGISSTACSNWTVSDATSSGGAGSTDATSWMWDRFYSACDESQGLLCMQTDSGPTLSAFSDYG